MERLNLKKTLSSWAAVRHLVRPIKSKSDYQARLKYLHELMKASASNGDSRELNSLIKSIVDVIEVYEKGVFEAGKPDPIGNLKYLMEEHRLTQRDLAELGSQGRVSEILSGKRPLSKRHIEKLALRFNVSPSVFFDKRFIGAHAIRAENKRKNILSKRLRSKHVAA